MPRLTLGRRHLETITIGPKDNPDEITITLVAPDLKRKQVRICIEAPAHYHITRGELRPSAA